MAKKSSYGFRNEVLLEATECTCEKRIRKVESEDDNIVKEKKRRFEIMDDTKKLQCSVMLKLMAHRYGWAFSKSDCCDATSKPMDLKSITSKLDKGLYKGTDEFASDIYVMLSSATMYHANNEIRKCANKFKRDFELKWTSLEKRWASETAKKEQILLPNKSEPSRKLHLKAPLVPKANEEREKKSISELTCAEQCIAKPKQHFLDTILESRERLLDFGHKAELQRRKEEREKARMKLQEMKRSIWISDNLKSFQELELLCGHSLLDSTTSKLKPLECLGLVLKDE